MSSKYYGDLSKIFIETTNQLSLRHDAREQALSISRAVIRLSANAIRAVHRSEFVEAESLIADARLKLKETETIKDDNPEIYYAGFLSDARKEFCEANVTLAIISGKALPYPADLEVDATDYLNGIAEVIGELRRYILDALRNDKYVDLCEQFMEIMHEIYGVFVMVDFPEAVTNGLRRSTDAMRGVLERTRGDLTMSLRQRQLEIQLKEWEDTRR